MSEKLMLKEIAIEAINGMIDNNGIVIPQNFGVCSRKIMFAKEFDLAEHDAKVREDAINEFVCRIINRKLCLDSWQWYELNKIAEQIKEQKNEID